MNWSRGVVPLCVDASALELQNRHLLLIPESAVYESSDGESGLYESSDED